MSTINGKSIYNRDIKISRHAVKPPLTLDFYVLNMLKTCRITAKYDFPSSKDMASLRQIVTTTVLNLVTGVWSVIKTPTKQSNLGKPMVLRTPEEMFHDNYVTIIPSYLTSIAKEIKVIEDSISANDRKTALESINAIKKLISSNVAKNPQAVVDYVDNLVDYSNLFQLAIHPKSKSRRRYKWLKTDFKYTRIKLKKTVPLEKYRVHFGDRGLQFCDDNYYIDFKNLIKEKQKK